MNRLGRQLALCLVTVSCLASFAQGEITADGLLADWGVTPFTDWTPNPDVRYVVEDWPNASYPYGGESFDVEAIYATRQNQAGADQLCVAIVQSMDPNGDHAWWDPNLWAVPGDLRLILGGTTYGIRISNLQANGPAPPGGPLVDPARSGALGSAWLEPDWHGVIPGGMASGAPTYFTGGTLVGQASGFFYDEVAAYEETKGTSTTSTYVIEMVVPTSLFAAWAGDDVAARWTMTCGNDVIELADEIQPEFLPPVPEPSCLVLFSLAGAGALIRRRKA